MNTRFVAVLSFINCQIWDYILIYAEMQVNFLSKLIYLVDNNIIRYNVLIELKGGGKDGRYER